MSGEALRAMARRCVELRKVTDLVADAADRQVEWLRGEVETLQAARNAVLALHRPRDEKFANGAVRKVCATCDCCGAVYWPCDTVKALGVTS